MLTAWCSSTVKEPELEMLFPVVGSRMDNRWARAQAARDARTKKLFMFGRIR